MKRLTPDTSAPRLCDLSVDELAEWCRGVGQPTYRARQVFHWVFQKRVVDPARMDDLPKPFRELLADRFQILSTRNVRHLVSQDGTEKLLLALQDGGTVECVLMREGKRRTACISTQVGCGMGCVFCASGLKGLARNLTRGEILEQLLQLQRLLPSDERLSNIVVMGMGEPLANLDELLPALQTILDRRWMGISARRITVSTVGLPDRIRRLADAGDAFTLAISLHAPNDRLRDELVRANRGIGIRAILEAAEYYFQRTGRRVSYEYVLLGNVNDHPTHARQLAALLQGHCAHVNLIPMNPVSGLPFRAPAAARVRRFVEALERKGIAVSVRKRKGADIDAACGQLRLRTLREQARPERPKSE